MKHRPAVAAAAALLLVSLLGQPARARPLFAVRIRAPELRMSDAPAVWRRVSLGVVHGVEQTRLQKGISLYIFGKAPARYLADVLRQRMRSGGAPLGRLSVTDLKLAMRGRGGLPRHLGVSATVVLQRAERVKKLRFEHSVFCAAPKDSKCRAVYARALIDLSDRILFDESALAFFGVSSPPRLADSALLTRDAPGPMLRVGRDGDALRTSRTLWTSMDVDGGGFLEMRAGEAFSAVVGADVRYWYGGWGTRAQVGLGASKQPSFLAQADLGLDFGYRGVRKSGGYVQAPGFSIVVSPRSAIFFSSNGAGLAVLYGASIEIEAYFTKDIGLMAGFFGGGATVKDVISATGTFFPYFELFFHSRVGKFALGMNLRRFHYDAPVFGGGALLTFGWRAHVGRGVDAAGSRVVASPAYRGPRGKYDGRRSAFARHKRREVFSAKKPAPALAALGPAAAAGAPTIKKGAAAPGRPPLAVLVGRLHVGAKLGAVARGVLRSAVMAELAARKAVTADDKKVASVAKLLGLGALDTATKACSAARSLQNKHALMVHAVLDPADGKRVKLAVSLHVAADCSSSAASKTVPRVEMLRALRALVGKLVDAAHR